MSTENSVKDIAEIARQAAGVDIIEIVETSVRDQPIHFAAIPGLGGQISLRGLKAELDEWRTRPEFIKGTSITGTLQSFIDLVNRHKNDNSALFADLDPLNPSLLGVIDYHTLDHVPQFGQHRISYAFPISEEWRAWQAANGKQFTQGEWSFFIEEHIADLSSPYDAERSEYESLFHTKFGLPSDIVQLSRGLQICVDSRVKEIRSLQSGEVEVSYEEVHKDGQGEKLIIPGLFVVNIPLFIGAEKTRLIARLRYRKDGSRINWFFQLYRADLEIRAYLERTFIDVQASTGLPGFEGLPEA